MNKLISPKDFYQSFKVSSVEKSSGSNKLAKNLVLSLSVMAGSATAEQTGRFEAPNILTGTNEDFSQYIEGEQLKTLDPSNFEDVMNEKVSGVYKHPFNEGEVIALSFTEDPYSNSRIMSDLYVQFKDYGNLNFSKFLDNSSNFYLNTSTKENTNTNSSSHIQDPFELGFDVNYTVVDTKNSFLPQDILDVHPEYEKFERYFIYIHETGHSLESQQMNLIDFAESLFNKDDLMRMENSSDFVAAIMTAQYMNEKGQSLEQIEDFLMTISKERINDLGNVKITNEIAAHITSSTLYVAIEMIRTNPEKVLNLQPKEIENIADVVSEMAITNNYSSDVIHNVFNDSDMEKAIGNAQNIIIELKTMMENEPEEFAEMMRVMKEKADLEQDPKMRQQFTELYEELMKAVNEPDLDIAVHGMIAKGYNIQENIDIRELDSQLQINKRDVLEYPDFAEKALDKLEKDNLWDASVVAEENGIDIDRVVDLANLNHVRGKSREKDNEQTFGY